MVRVWRLWDVGLDQQGQENLTVIVCLVARTVNSAVVCFILSVGRAASSCSGQCALLSLCMVSFTPGIDSETARGTPRL